jgi:hypothetical protein
VVKGGGMKALGCGEKERSGEWGLCSWEDAKRGEGGGTMDEITA